jgi:hypothetical protein
VSKGIASERQRSHGCRVELDALGHPFELGVPLRHGGTVPALILRAPEIHTYRECLRQALRCGQQQGSAAAPHVEDALITSKLQTRERLCPHREVPHPRRVQVAGGAREQPQSAEERRDRRAARVHGSQDDQRYPAQPQHEGHVGRVDPVFALSSRARTFFHGAPTTCCGSVDRHQPFRILGACRSESTRAIHLLWVGWHGVPVIARRCWASSAAGALLGRSGGTAPVSAGLSLGVHAGTGCIAARKSLSRL